MSKFTDDLVSHIKEYPDDWDANSKMSGIVLGNIEISCMGNTRLVSVVSLFISGTECDRLTYRDRWKLEVALLNWYKNCGLSKLLKKQK